MAFRRHNPQWLGVYRSDNSNYVRSGEPVLVGGSAGYNTLIGFNSTAMLDDINTSKVQPRIHLRMNVTNAGTFDYGVHKSTTNKASSGIPFYRWTGRSFNPSTGSKSYDITDFNINVDGNSTFIQAMKNDGYHGPVLYGGSGGAYGEATGIYIEIEGTWNEPPTKPTLTYPVGGEVLSGDITATADPSTDPEGDAITYQWAVKDPDGWWYFDVGDGNVKRTIQLNEFKETSTAQIGVRAYDGQSYSEWERSDVFTIRHNIPPSQPTLNEPIGGVSRDRTKTIRFLWNHNDSDPQSLFRFRWRLQGAATWNEIETVTTDEVVAIPGNTFPAGNIEWQIQTEDQGGLVSPWSSSGLFLSTEKSDAPTITSPAEAEVIPSETMNVTWSSSGQEQYEVEVLDGTTVHWSVSRTSGNKGVTIGEPLTNNTAYTIRLRIADSGGLWSDWAEVNVTTSFTPPTQAEIEVSSDEATASIYLDITNPLPGGTQPTVTHNDLYRRRQGETWTRIAKGLEPNSGFMDYTPAGNIVYEYRVTSYGDNDTRMDSVAVIGSVNVDNTFLSLASNPTTFIELDMVKPQSSSTSFNASQMQFAGRKYPVTEFGENQLDNLNLSIMIYNKDYQALAAILSARQTLLYRDEQGDKRFITVMGFNESYVNSELRSVNFSPVTVSYSEGV